MNCNPESLLSEVEGYRFCQLMHMVDDGYWSCAIYTYRLGEEISFHNTGADIYNAIQRTVADAKGGE